MKKLLVFLLLLISVIPSRSATAIYNSVSTGIIPIQEAERVLYFTGNRVWQTVDGIVLVCPYQYEAGERSKYCKGKVSSETWVPLNNLHIPGYEISGVIFYVDVYYSNREVQVFFRKK